MLGLMLMAGATLPALLAPPEACPKTRGDEIVVCGSREEADEHFRLRTLPPKYTEDYDVSLKLPGGASLAPKAAGGRLGDAQAKVTLTIPF